MVNWNLFKDDFKEKVCKIWNKMKQNKTLVKIFLKNKSFWLISMTDNSVYKWKGCYMFGTIES